MRNEKAHNFKDLAGQRFGKLVAQYFINEVRTNRGERFWICICDCGRTTKTRTSRLTSGATKSCGCYRAEVRGRLSRTHGFFGTKEFILYAHARDRARIKKLEFNLHPSDIHIPERCPLLDIPLKMDKKGRGPAPNSPSIDRIDPTKGYIKGNIWIISHRANTMKSNSSLEEFLLLAKNWEKRLTQSTKSLEVAA